MPKQLEYDEKYSEFTKILENEKSIVLATLDRDKVAARTVYFVFYKSFIYFLTSAAYSKYKQIVRNPNVALCVDNIQIEGTARIMGHPGLEENNSILTHYLQKCPENDRYIKHKNTVLIEVEINKIELWKDSGREYINPNEKSAYRIG